MENNDPLPAGDVQKGQNFMIPGAIILAGVIIAGAVVYSSGSSAPAQKAAVGDAAPRFAAAENIKPITSDDHILGDINAPIVVVEFSDLECPFCKRFHSTMQQVVDRYSGQVAWAYRHFPLVNLHPKAFKEAEATECAAELGGNDSFWAYTDRLFEITPSNNGLDPEELPRIAEFIGLDVKNFKECLDSERYKDHVSSDSNDAVNSGGTGTPYSVVVSASGKMSIIPGALEYDQVKGIIDEVLATE